MGTQWTTDTPEPRPVSHKLRVGDITLSVSRDNPEDKWLCHAIYSGGEFVESEDAPLGKAVDLAIERATRWLADLKVIREADDADN